MLMRNYMVRKEVCIIDHSIMFPVPSMTILHQRHSAVVSGNTCLQISGLVVW